MTVATGSSMPAMAGISDARQRLYEAAIELFGERGVHGVSVRDLMGALGQQPGALYGHAQSKEDLLFQLVTIGHELHRDALRDALLDTGREPVDQVKALTRAHVLIHLAYPALARVSARESRALTDEHKLVVLQVRHDSEQMFFDVIERGRRIGVFAVRDAEMAVRAIGAMGIRSVEWWTPESGVDPDYLANTYADYAAQIAISKPV